MNVSLLTNPAGVLEQLARVGDGDPSGREIWAWARKLEDGARRKATCQPPPLWIPAVALSEKRTTSPPAFLSPQEGDDEEVGDVRVTVRWERGNVGDTLPARAGLESCLTT